MGKFNEWLSGEQIGDPPDLSKAVYELRFVDDSPFPWQVHRVVNGHRYRCFASSYRTSAEGYLETCKATQLTNGLVKKMEAN
jgi:hypothetical protein